MPEPAPSDAPVRSDSDCVFVYGTLMRGFDLHHHMASASFVSTATVPGALYVVDAYAGRVEGGATVHGEVYRFDDIAVALEVLDEVEEYDPLDVPSSAYVRVLRLVRLDKDGRTASAWLYLYNRDTKGLTPIKSGDWRSR